MRIKHYYCLTQTDKRIAPAVIDCLSKYHHKFKATDFSLIRNETWYSFYVCEDEPVWEELKPLLSYRKPNISENVFSQKEISEAKWLSMRSDNATKIYCDDDAVDRVFSFVYHDGRTRHRTQIAPYELRKTVKWNASRMFYGADGCGFTNLFTSNLGHERLSAYFNGVSFLPVYKFKTTTPLDDIWQLRFDNRLPNESIVFGRGEEDISCPVCHRPQYLPPHLYRLAIYKEYLNDDVDFYTTEEIFYEGFADAFVICSHQAYMKLKEHGMAAKLRFEPVELV